MLLVTGGSGLIGSALKKFVTEDAVFVSSSEYDLRNELDVVRMFDDIQPTKIIHLAARTGGVMTNTLHPVEFFEDNILMNTLILKHAHARRIERFVGCSSACIFPDNIGDVLRADLLHSGPPHDSNFGFAYAKRMMDIQIRAYNKQYNKNWITVIPTNTYGPHDKFNLQEGHVIPAIIHKCFLAKQSRENLLVQGTGKTFREFIYIDDLAKILLLVLNTYTECKPLIISNPVQYQIDYVIKTIAKLIGFNGEIIYTGKYDGQDRKLIDIKPMHKFIPSYQFTSLENGLQETVEWFVHNYKDARL